MKKIFAVFCVLAISLTWFVAGIAQEKKAEPAKPKYDFIGAKKCMMCHKKDGTGPSWEKTPHATAWAGVDALKLEEKKKEECKSCHATGVTPQGEFLAGVQCEACHGAGSAYKDMKIMKDKQLAIANGLVIPDEKTCVRCHDKAKAPAPYHAKMPDKFEWAKMKEKGIHTLPVKAQP